MYAFATIVSRLFEPMIVLLIISVIGAFAYQLPQGEFLSFVGVALFGMVLPIAFYRWYIVKKKIVTNWDITDRKQRIKPLIGLVFIILLSTYFSQFIFSLSLVQLFIIYSLWIVGFFAITLFWKISGHAGSVALAVFLFLHWYGLAWWPALFLIVVVGWARVFRKDHTLAQVIGGVVYSLLIVYLSYAAGLV